TDDKDQIVAGGDQREGQADGLADPALGPVAPHRRAELLTDDKAAADTAATAGDDIEGHEGRVIGAPLAPRAPKLLGPAQPGGAVQGSRPMARNRVPGTVHPCGAALFLDPVVVCLVPASGGRGGRRRASRR